jgi:hypothetical protein
MSTTIPGYSHLGDPFALEVSATGTALTLTAAAWPGQSLSVAVLCVEVLDEGESVVLLDDSATVYDADCPFDISFAAWKDGTDVGKMRTPPFTFAYAGTVKLFASTTTVDVRCRWIAIPSWGE